MLVIINKNQSRISHKNTSDSNVLNSHKIPLSTQLEVLKNKNFIQSQNTPIFSDNIIKRNDDQEFGRIYFCAKDAQILNQDQSNSKQTSLAHLVNNSNDPHKSLTKDPVIIQNTNVADPINFAQDESKSPSLLRIPIIPESNECSEQSLNIGNQTSSKNLLSTPLNRHEKIHGIKIPQQSIKPRIVDKFFISSSNQDDEKIALINIAGIRNKQINDFSNLNINKRKTSDLSPKIEFYDLTLGDDTEINNLLQPHTPKKVENDKKFNYKDILIRNMNKINIGPKKKIRRNTTRKMSEALPSIFDLTNEISFHGNDQGLGLPSGLLDDSDFFTEKQRYEMLKRRKMKKKSLAVKSPTRRLLNKSSLTNKERKNIIPNQEDYVIEKKVEKEEASKIKTNEDHDSTEEEEDDEEKFMIDIRYLKPAPNFKKEYDSMSMDDILPSKKERELRIMEEAEQRNIRESRLKLQFKVTRNDEKKAKDRFNSYYNRSGATSILPVQTSINTARIRKQKEEEEALEEQVNKAMQEQEEFRGSTTRFGFGKSSTKNLSRKRTGFANSVHLTTAGTKGHNHHYLTEEDYLSSEKMNDFVEVLNKIQKPFSNEAEIDNSDIEVKRTKEFNFHEEFKTIRVNFIRFFLIVDREQI